MIREIITDENTLSVVCESSLYTPDFYLVIEDLLDTANHAKTQPTGCLGLAANQIGFTLPIFVAWVDNDFEVFCDPIITPNHTFGKLSDYERCLSRPEIKSKIARYKRINVNYLDENGSSRSRKFSGKEARIIQHEADHLLGKYIK